MDETGVLREGQSPLGDFDLDGGACSSPGRAGWKSAGGKVVVIIKLLCLVPRQVGHRPRPQKDGPPAQSWEIHIFLVVSIHSEVVVIPALIGVVTVQVSVLYGERLRESIWM